MLNLNYIPPNLCLIWYKFSQKSEKNSNIIKRAQCAETNSGMGLALFINLSIESKIGI